MRWVSLLALLAGACASARPAPTLVATLAPASSATVLPATLTPTATASPAATFAPTATPTPAPTVTATPTAIPTPRGEVVVHLVGDVMLARSIAGVPPAQVFAGQSAILSLTVTADGLQAWELLPVRVVEGLPISAP